MPVAAAVRPAALGTLGTPARSGARWRVHTALSALGRRIGATRRTSIPSRTRGDIAHCAPAAVCASARSGTPWPTSKTRTEAGHRRASTRAPFLDVHLALDASARCPPAPCSQSSTSTLSATKMGSLHCLPLRPQARTAYPSAPRRIWPFPPHLSPPLACPRPSLTDIPALSSMLTWLWVRLACRCNCSLKERGPLGSTTRRRMLHRAHDGQTHAHTHART